MQISFDCLDCGEEAVLRKTYFGSYGSCGNGCYGGFKKIEPSSVVPCKWNPAKGRLAADLQDEKFYWHNGCENIAVKEGYCQSCYDIVKGRKDGKLIIQAFKDAAAAYVKMKEENTPENKAAHKAAHRKYRDLCGFPPPREKKSRKKDSTVAHDIEVEFKLLAADWEIYLLKHPKVKMSAPEVVSKIRNNQRPPIEFVTLREV